MDTVTLSDNVIFSAQSGGDEMAVDFSMFTLYMGTTKGMAHAHVSPSVTVRSDGSGVVSGSVSSSEIHFVINFGDVGFDIDSTSGVWC